MKIKNLPMSILVTKLPDRKCNYCFKNSHVESICFNKPGGRFNPDIVEPRPRNPRGWVDYKEPNIKGTKKIAASRTENEEGASQSADNSRNNSGATDDENTGVRRAMIVRVLQASKATEEDIQTVFASIRRTKEGWKQSFFCDSGADVCLVN